MNTATAEKKAPAIKMEKVESRQIAERGYDPATNTLAVRFKKGGTYLYHDFTAKHWEAFQKAPSIGSFFHTHIRDKFKFTGPGEAG